MKHTKNIECPRCLGKGQVEFSDIERLGREAEWIPGPCAYCHEKGFVDETKPERVDPADPDIVHEYFIECPRCLGKGYMDDDDIYRFDKVGAWQKGPCNYCDATGVVDRGKLTIYDPANEGESPKTTPGKISMVFDTKTNQELRVNSFAQFVDFFEDAICPHFVFRGVSNHEYGLKSKVGRSLEKYSSRKDFIIREETLLELFKSKATAHTGMQQLSDWQWICLAQHYGLSTRLLDWTENPLVAMYFASLGNDHLDGAIYSWHFSKAINISTLKPLSVEKSGFFIPPYLTNRIIAQSSVFSVSANPWKELHEDFEGEIFKFIITKEFKKELKSLLPRLGISRRTIFADLDSYAHDIDTLFKIDSNSCRGGVDFTIHY